MIVVADSSPIIALVNIGQIAVLPALFGEVVIPPAVAEEVSSSSRPKAVRDFFLSRPNWLKVIVPKVIQSMPSLHRGEIEALSLAIELHADLVLIDEREAYREAVTRRLNAVGTVNILERAAAAGLLDLSVAFDNLKRTDFWISNRLLDERLELFHQHQREKKSQ